MEFDARASSRLGECQGKWRFGHEIGKRGLLVAAICAPHAEQRAEREGGSRLARQEPHPQLRRVPQYQECQECAPPARPGQPDRMGGEVYLGA